MASQVPTDLTKLIDKLIETIDLVQEQLRHPSADPATHLAVPKVSAVEVERLKVSVDQFRLFLWAYLDSWSQGTTPEARLQRIRMEAATDMLRHLATDFDAAGVPKSSEASRLGEQLRAIEDVMIERRTRTNS